MLESVIVCEACNLASGTSPLPGGRLHRTTYWLVEHCVGPLGLGSLIVKPERHVTAVSDLTVAEAEELGPLLRLTSDIASRLVDAEQVYNCLWSHAGATPGHIHYVVQPVTKQQMTDFNCYGPALQMAMFTDGPPLVADEVVAICDQARDLFRRS